MRRNGNFSEMNKWLLLHFEHFVRQTDYRTDVKIEREWNMYMLRLGFDKEMIWQQKRKAGCGKEVIALLKKALKKNGRQMQPSPCGKTCVRFNNNIFFDTGSQNNS